jgi:hypothetical protein
MSRDLPLHPNLEHLRNQAKERLRQLRLQDPALQLADALHAIARNYGFASWPLLKAHVESLPLATESPFDGDWRANVSASKRHPDNPFQNASLRLAVVGDTVTITDVVVDASGRKEEGRNTLHADGKARPSEYGGYVVVARRIGPRVLEAAVTKDGQVAGRVRYEVSADNQTLTVTGTEQVIVFDRVPVRDAWTA